MALASTPKRLQPVPSHLVAKGRDGVDVAGHGVVGEMASHHARQPAPLLGDGQVPASLEARSFTCFSFARIRFLMVMRRSQKRPSLVFPQMCVKPKKSNVSGLPRPRSDRFWAAKRPNSMRRVLSGCSSRLNFANRSRRSCEELLCITKMLEPDDEVIGEPGDDHVAPGVPLSPLPDPPVEDVVKVDVSEQRRNRCPLR